MEFRLADVNRNAIQHGGEFTVYTTLFLRHLCNVPRTVLISLVAYNVASFSSAEKSSDFL
jgi:hypothetical protein